MLSKDPQPDYQPVAVKDIRPLGALTRLTLQMEGNPELIEAEVAHDDNTLSGLHRGDIIQFKPKTYNHDWEI
ncbi:TOBE-like domain-containing protein [Lonsdalea quercina]